MPADPRLPSVPVGVPAQLPRRPHVERDAFTVLPPLPPAPPPPPTSYAYRLAPAVPGRGKQAAFAVVAEITPPKTPPPPEGRVSPFRGRGFRPPTRASSRAASPSPSAKRRRPSRIPRSTSGSPAHRPAASKHGTPRASRPASPGNAAGPEGTHEDETAPAPSIVTNGASQDSRQSQEAEAEAGAGEPALLGVGERPQHGLSVRGGLALKKALAGRVAASKAGREPPPPAPAAEDGSRSGRGGLKNAANAAAVRSRLSSPKGSRPAASEEPVSRGARPSVGTALRLASRLQSPRSRRGAQEQDSGGGEDGRRASIPERDAARRRLQVRTTQTAMSSEAETAAVAAYRCARLRAWRRQLGAPAPPTPPGALRGPAH
ncbi:atherin-like [Schistocerca gregaria]|uniref:atherin-like n=1 Tax=Schistocerca gregaria TaxID=7010 RepID=UPI00211F2567|nr:atherin-like [Schistocerca gregaria]